MYAEMTTLVSVLGSDELVRGDVIGWSAPVPFFGHLDTAKIATVGINPSNREFVDAAGFELAAAERRLPTLRSLGLNRWDDADFLSIRRMLVACTEYFERNPYDGWFRVLQGIIEGTGRSYYAPFSDACHLDLVPWATESKWGALPPSSRSRLISSAASSLRSLLCTSSIEMLILNGQEVVRQFEILARRDLIADRVEAWDLPRRVSNSVPGLRYRDTLTEIGGFPLDTPITVIGYNHNLQSSYGVTSQVRDGIREWVARVHAETVISRPI